MVDLSIVFCITRGSLYHRIPQVLGETRVDACYGRISIAPLVKFGNRESRDPMARYGGAPVNDNAKLG